LALSTTSPAASASTNIIATGHESKIDVGLANDTHYFFEAAGAGLDLKRILDNADIRIKSLGPVTLC
jgi:diacylglycerol kinase family enzyme